MAMSRRYSFFAAAPLVVALTLAVTDVATGQSKENALSTHRLTIYVDEGKDQLNGHVFVAVENGALTKVSGFYPQKKGAGALAGLNGGEVRGDWQKIDKGEWDVKRTYNITESQYRNALRVIEDFERKRRDWSPQCHCGTMAEEVARAAGIRLDLPTPTFDFDTRPAQFAAYLRARGGVTNDRTKRPAPAAAPAPGERPASKDDACGECLAKCSTIEDCVFSRKGIACNNACPCSRSILRPDLP
jgi:hypothetical protein